MSAAPVSVLLLALALLTVPSVVAQDHEHDGASAGLLLQSDLPPDGRAVAGGIAHFEYVLLADDGTPLPHHDVAVEITHNNITLYHTPGAHDYDGVGGIDVVFPTPGTYTVRVWDPADEERTASYSGYVVPMEPDVTASIEYAAPDEAEAGTLVPFTYRIVDENGSLVPHVDALVQIRRTADDFTVLEAHTHQHTDEQSFSYAFEKAGVYSIRIIGYTAFPSTADVLFENVVHLETIRITGSPVATAAPLDTPIPAPEPPVSGANARDGEHAHPGDDYVSHMAADPVTGTNMIAGPYSKVRTSFFTYETTNHTLVQHIDYEARLTGPNGVVFESSALHEYDGVLRILSANEALGQYLMSVTASQGEWDESQSLAYEVAAANLPLQAGPQFIDVAGLDALRSAQPGTIDFFVHGAGGTPFMHSEVDFEVLSTHGLTLLDHKLHTHSTGTFTFDYAPAESSGYILQVDPFDIHGSPTPIYYGQDPLTGRALHFEVGQGDTWPIDPSVVSDDPPRIETEAAPGVTFMAALLVALVGHVIAYGRRT